MRIKVVIVSVADHTVTGIYFWYNNADISGATASELLLNHHLLLGLLSDNRNNNNKKICELVGSVGDRKAGDEMNEQKLQLERESTAEFYGHDVSTHNATLQKWSSDRFRRDIMTLRWCRVSELSINSKSPVSKQTIVYFMWAGVQK